MKKVLTILAILVVLTSAVFAETHSIKIKATKAAVPPEFQMVIGSVTTNDGEVRGAFGADDYELIAETDAFGDTWDTGFEVAKTVNVLVKIANAAKTTQNYLLTFRDGVFEVLNNGVAGEDVVPTITAEGKTNTGFKALTVSDDDTAKIDFTGVTCTANTTIATATYVYPVRTDVDPGTYTANVTLEITVAN